MALRPLGNVRGFDGVRGIGAILVVITHLELILPLPTFTVIPGSAVPLDAFFTLSGFLITTVLLREQARTGRIGMWGFYRRRILRLYPALLVVLAAQVIFSIISGLSFHEEWTSVMSVAFYYSNWKMAWHSTFFGPDHFAPSLEQMWSLSYEEQFYLLWPLLTVLFFTARRRLRTVIPVMLVIIGAIWIHRALLYTGESSWYGIFIRTDTRADSILIGALGAHIWAKAPNISRYLPWAAWGASAFLIASLFPWANVYGPYLYRGGFDAVDASCVIIVLALADGRWVGRRLFEWKPFVHAGTVSYGTYVWHILIFDVVRYYCHAWRGFWGDTAKLCIALPAVWLLSSASWFLVERRFLRRKTRKQVAGVDGEAKTPSILPAPGAGPLPAPVLAPELES